MVTEKKRSSAKIITSGMLSGSSVVLLLSPVDKALYLSAYRNRPFLTRQNFISPFQCIGSALIARSLTTGLFFPLIDATVDLFNNIALTSSKTANSFLAGNSVGMATGLINNFFNAVRYKSWSFHPSATFRGTLSKMVSERRLSSLLSGYGDLLLRDFIFGGVFSLIRNQLRPDWKERSGGKKDLRNLCVSNFTAAALAALASSPFNYVRNVKYWTEAGGKAPRSREILGELLRDIFRGKDKRRNWYRLQPFWGTARVTFGIGLSALLYDLFVSF